MVIENFRCAKHSICHTAHHGWARRRKVENKGSQKAGKRYLEVGFCISSTSYASYFAIV